MCTIACCSFPTTLLVLDDDKDLLDSIQFVLSDKYPFLCTSNLKEAHDILNKNREWTKSLLEKGVSRIYPIEEKVSQVSLTVNVLLLKKQIYNPDRFKNITVLIIDYDMPKKNGLEFIKELNDPQLKVIMLTGKATQDTVIKAFNDRKIHRYVSKGDPDYLEKVSQYVNELQTEFFFDFSKFILDSLRGSQNKVFENKSLVDLFNKVIRENKIVEYYLLDESGSFLMLDETADNQIWFIIKSKQEIRDLYEIAKDDSPDFSAEKLKKLKDCKILTYFKDSKEFIKPASTWHFIEAQPLDEKKTFFYAVVKNDSHFHIKRSQIKSYQEFIKERR